MRIRGRASLPGLELRSRPSEGVEICQHRQASSPFHNAGYCAMPLEMGTVVQVRLSD